MGMQCPPLFPYTTLFRSEGLGGGGLHDLPHVHVHLREHHLELVDQRDVDRPVDVLEQLGRLGHLGAGHPVHLPDHLLVER